MADKLTGSDSGSSMARSIRAKKRANGIGRLKEKADAGEFEGNERGYIQLGPLNTSILVGEEDLSTWDMEELRQGRKRNKNGNWTGRVPKVVPKAVHDELVRRTLSEANEKLTQNLTAAVEALTMIVTDEGVEAKDRLRAISMVMDRVMGKSPDKVEISGTAKWEVALEGGIVPITKESLGHSEDEPEEGEDG